MTSRRFREVSTKYSALTIAVIGDICLDRYLEIDPARTERSLETGLDVYNVTNVRYAPGAAGTVINNLCALGIGRILPVGFCGDDAEGFELRRALSALPGVSSRYFLSTAERRTFTYTKPLVIRRGRPPEELNRLDLKNWTRTPPAVERALAQAVIAVAARADALIVLDQVDHADTGVVTGNILQTIAGIMKRKPGLIVVGDSRRGLGHFPPMIYKMNRTELGIYLRRRDQMPVDAVGSAAVSLAKKTRQPVFISMAESGIMGASPAGEIERARSLPVRGPIDVVGAGDSVTANVVAALASGAALSETLKIAMCAASVVVHKLGTTGTASPKEIGMLLGRMG